MSWGSGPQTSKRGKKRFRAYAQMHCDLVLNSYPDIPLSEILDEPLSVHVSTLFANIKKLSSTYLMTLPAVGAAGPMPVNAYNFLHLLNGWVALYFVKVWELVIVTDPADDCPPSNLPEDQA